MWVKTRTKLINLDQCWGVTIDDIYFKDKQPCYTLIAVIPGENGGQVELETYELMANAKEAYTYLHQCLALNAALCDLPTKGAVKL